MKRNIKEGKPRRKESENKMNLRKNKLHFK
jgi:hypothetical protein